MKIAAIALLFSSAAVVGLTSAFCPSFGVRARMNTAVITNMAAAGPEGEEEEEGFDLDLGEMFEMFDAADQGTDFDEAVEKIKGDDN